MHTTYKNANLVPAQVKNYTIDSHTDLATALVSTSVTLWETQYQKSARRPEHSTISKSEECKSVCKFLRRWLMGVYKSNIHIYSLERGATRRYTVEQ